MIPLNAEITPAGLAALATAAQAAEPVKITHLAVGDGNGAGYVTVGGETNLKNPLLTAPIANSDVNGGEFKFGVAFTGDASFTVYEAKAMLDNGDTFCIWASLEPFQAVWDGAEFVMNMGFNLIGADADLVSIIVPPTIKGEKGDPGLKGDPGDNAPQSYFGLNNTPDDFTDDEGKIQVVSDDGLSLISVSLEELGIIVARLMHLPADMTDMAGFVPTINGAENGGEWAAPAGGGFELVLDGGPVPTGDTYQGKPVMIEAQSMALQPSTTSTICFNLPSIQCIIFNAISKSSRGQVNLGNYSGALSDVFLFAYNNFSELYIKSPLPLTVTSTVVIYVDMSA